MREFQDTKNSCEYLARYRFESARTANVTNILLQ